MARIQHRSSPALRCFLASFLTALVYLASLHPRPLIARVLYGRSRRPRRRA